MEDKIKKILAMIFEVDPVTINEETSPATVPEWDSLNHMKLVFAIEEEFEVEFSDEQIIQLTNIANIINCLQKLI